MLQGCGGVRVDWPGNRMVQPVCFQAVRHCPLHGPSAATSGIPLRFVVWSLRSYYHILDTPLHY
jgi:hypothetical protein